MNITDEMIDKLEALAKIRLNGEEKERVKGELFDLIDYIDVIAQLDTDGAVEKCDSESALRADEVKPSRDRELILQNAPERSGAFFAVPKAVEEGEK